MLRKILFLLIAVLLNGSLWAQNTEEVLVAKDISAYSKSAKNKDYQAVHNAILDYVEGLYLADSTRIERSVHPDLHKRGFWFSPEDKVYKDNLDMTYEQLVNLAARWNKSGKRANEQSPKLIEIFEVTDKTASAKLTAEWGMDYFHLAKIEGRWYIMNVLWQSIVAPRLD